MTEPKYVLVPVELCEALRWAIEYIDAIPPETVLPAMPGFDRDSVNALLSARPDLSGMREEVARLLFERGRTVHDAASWEAAGPKMQEWLLEHADDILNLLGGKHDAG